jgi:hypothetical protein
MVNDHTWYVTFEVPKSSTLTRRRNPRSTRTFATEAEAKDFARVKFGEGLVVTAGTIIPYSPRQAIPSTGIPAWLGSAEEGSDQDPETLDQGLRRHSIFFMAPVSLAPFKCTAGDTRFSCSVNVLECGHFGTAIQQGRT